MVVAEGVTKDYPAPGGSLRVLEELSLRLEPGSAAVITGPSGTGKSTILYLLGALDRPTTGKIEIDGVTLATLSEAAAASFRNQHIGFVFQDHALLPHCTALENVLVPAVVAKGGAAARMERARMLIDAVGITERADHKPAQLSGGERQRVAIARALILEPSVLLCDEPTGNLDASTALTVADLLVKLQAESRATLVLVTHSTELAARFPLRYQLRDRRLVPA
ncbi:MAG TPA: ABC transporter ATP-binding protein [Bryobacteraceae bacterium]|nr:ABC transporter ATP-binding protein [Bryobacteraceae bacterium]